jgi:hypothetical protein
MPGLVPGIHVFPVDTCKDVDGISNSGLPELRENHCGKSGKPDLQ